MYPLAACPGNIQLDPVRRCRGRYVVRSAAHKSTYRDQGQKSDGNDDCKWCILRTIFALRATLARWVLGDYLVSGLSQPRMQNLYCVFRRSSRLPRGWADITRPCAGWTYCIDRTKSMASSLITNYGQLEDRAGGGDLPALLLRVRILIAGHVSRDETCRPHGIVSSYIAFPPLGDLRDTPSP